MMMNDGQVTRLISRYTPNRVNTTPTAKNNLPLSVEKV
jgi:hypothetical protein